MNRLAILALVSLAATGCVNAAEMQTDTQTHTLGQHPAVLVKQQPQAINPNTFIVGHPASPTWVRGHANHEHPAVVAARMAEHPPIDTNAYLVQPPASTTWTLGPAVAAPDKVALAK